MVSSEKSSCLTMRPHRVCTTSTVRLAYSSAHPDLRRDRRSERPDDPQVTDLALRTGAREFPQEALDRCSAVVLARPAVLTTCEAQHRSLAVAGQQRMMVAGVQRPHRAPQVHKQRLPQDRTSPDGHGRTAGKRQQVAWPALHVRDQDASSTERSAKSARGTRQL